MSERSSTSTASLQGMTPSSQAVFSSFSQRLAQAAICAPSRTPACKNPFAMAWAMFPKPINPTVCCAIAAAPLSRPKAGLFRLKKV